jgi:membrane associated rhomboid family serine protease
LNIFNKLERLFGRYAIKGLIIYVIALNAFVFFVARTNPSSNIINKLTLIPSLVMSGEVWRLVTFIFIPPTFSVFWILFTLYFYYIVGTGLEHEWGSFKFNIYYFVGVLGTIAAAFITGSGSTGFYLNLSLFLAFAYIYPNYEILLFFVIPVKVKYIAWLNWVLIGFAVSASPAPEKAAAIASVANYFLFFGKDIYINFKTRRSAHHNRKKFSEAYEEKSTFHRCTICNITEKEDQKMEFRYCSTCEGDYEYCMNHLKNHEHIKK